jgi:threonine dehydratase
MRVVRPPDPADLNAAREVVESHLTPTPIVASPALGGGVVLKLETFQPTGSFKVRGGLAAVAAAMKHHPGQPIVTASAGNHGLGVAYAASVFGVTATVVVPNGASPSKLDALRRFPIELIEVGESYDDAEARALELANAGAIFVSPYNDPHTIAGQATIAYELFAQQPDLDTVIAPVGGGGLVSGIAIACAARGGVRVVGVEASASTAVRHAVEAGRAVTIDVHPTIADGLAGNLEPGSVTFDLVREHVDELTEVDEAALADGVRFAAREHGLVIEGSAAAGIAALRSGRVARGPGSTAVIVTGRNIALAKFVDIVRNGA